MPQASVRPMDSEAFARRCVEVCEDRKAGDVILFDVRNISVLADFYILCTANSEPHLRAVQDHLHQELAKTGVRPRGREGVAASRWVIVDYGDVLIHVMDPERRDYYRLEELCTARTWFLGLRRERSERNTLMLNRWPIPEP